MVVENPTFSFLFLLSFAENVKLQRREGEIREEREILITDGGGAPPLCLADSWSHARGACLFYVNL